MPCSVHPPWRAGPGRYPEAAWVSKPVEELGQDGGSCSGEQLFRVLPAWSLSRALGFVWGANEGRGLCRTGVLITAVLSVAL